MRTLLLMNELVEALVAWKLLQPIVCLLVVCLWPVQHCLIEMYVEWKWWDLNQYDEKCSKSLSCTSPLTFTNLKSTKHFLKCKLGLHENLASYQNVYLGHLSPRSPDLFELLITFLCQVMGQQQDSKVGWVWTHVTMIFHYFSWEFSLQFFVIFAKNRFTNQYQKSFVFFPFYMFWCVLQY